MSDCPFNAPCPRYMGMLADRDEMQREIERLRAEREEIIAEGRFVIANNVAGWRKENDRLRAALIAIGEDPEAGLKIHAYVRTALGERG